MLPENKKIKLLRQFYFFSPLTLHFEQSPEQPQHLPLRFRIERSARMARMRSITVKTKSDIATSILYIYFIIANGKIQLNVDNLHIILYNYKDKML